MPILKTHNLSVADFTENENIYYLFPDNWSHQKGSNIVKILRDSDHGIPLYTGLSPIKPFDEERGMRQLDESSRSSKKYTYAKRFSSSSNK